MSADPENRATSNHERPMSVIRSGQVPSLCGWRPLLGVSAVSLLTALLFALGGPGVPGPGRLLLLVAWAQLLGLFCALGVCISRAWLRRMATRDAWLAAWLITFINAITLSYVVGVVGSVLGFGPGSEKLGMFMLKSVLAASLVWVALLRYLYIRAQWQAEMLAEAEARVQALQAHIHPHFLFNSLNTIASLIHDNPVAAERATEDLADLFRGGMRRADQPIRLEQELQLARKYLDMEQRRLGTRLEVQWQVDDLPADAEVLPMLLQPLLENAVGHGVQGLPEGGRVRLFGRLEGDAIVITVSNPVPPEGSHAGHGMALANIRARLELSYGERASLITSEDDNRFYAVLSLPHDAPDHR